MANDFEKNVELLNKIRDIRTPQLVYLSIFPVLDGIFYILFAFKLAHIGIVANISWWVVALPLILEVLIPTIKSFVAKVKLKMKNVGV